MSAVIVEGWAIDLARAMYERPLIFRLLLPAVLGRYAYREWLGMIQALEKEGMMIDLGYGLENLEYHAEPSPLRWWARRWERTG